MIILLYTTVVLFVFVLSSVAQVPRVISYQGVLVGADGKPVNQSGATVKISFYNAESGGSALSSTSYPVNIVGGLFSTIVTIPPASAMDLNQQLWLEVEYSNIRYKRVQLAASLYALNIADNVVTEQKIAPNAVTSAKIKDSAVTPIKLAPGTTDGQTLKWNASTNQWELQNDEGLRSVYVESPLSGNGTPSNPIKADIPSNVPVGTIVAYYGEITSTSEIPDGWLLCDGSTIPAGTEYNALRTICSRNGHTETTPDLRGFFLRGANITYNQIPPVSNDPDWIDRVGGSADFKIGSVQSDAIADHKHLSQHQVTGNNKSLTRYGFLNLTNNQQVSSAGGDISIGFLPKTSNPVNSDNNSNEEFISKKETRPKNVYVNYIIKAR